MWPTPGVRSAPLPEEGWAEVHLSAGDMGNVPHQELLRVEFCERIGVGFCERDRRRATARQWRAAPSWSCSAGHRSSTPTASSTRRSASSTAFGTPTKPYRRRCRFSSLSPRTSSATTDLPRRDRHEQVHQSLSGFDQGRLYGDDIIIAKRNGFTVVVDAGSVYPQSTEDQIVAVALEATTTDRERLGRIPLDQPPAPFGADDWMRTATHQSWCSEPAIGHGIQRANLPIGARRHAPDRALCAPKRGGHGCGHRESVHRSVRLSSSATASCNGRLHVRRVSPWRRARPGAASACSPGTIGAQVLRSSSIVCQRNLLVGVNFLVPFLDRSALEDAAERSPLVEFFWGEPDEELIAVAHRGGARAGWQVGSLDEALAVSDVGCDVLVVQGVEAGGHVRGTVGLLPLLDEVRSSVDIPLIAVGGIGTGRAMAAALTAGADAVRIGTRFLAALESIAHPVYVDALITARAGDTVRPPRFGEGWPDAPHRVRSRASPPVPRVAPPRSGVRTGLQRIAGVCPKRRRCMRVNLSEQCVR